MDGDRMSGSPPGWELQNLMNFFSPENFGKWSTPAGPRGGGEEALIPQEKLDDFIHKITTFPKSGRKNLIPLNTSENEEFQRLLLSHKIITLPSSRGNATIMARIVDWQISYLKKWLQIGNFSVWYPRLNLQTLDATLQNLPVEGIRMLNETRPQNPFFAFCFARLDDKRRDAVNHDSAQKNGVGESLFSKKVRERMIKWLGTYLGELKPPGYIFSSAVESTPTNEGAGILGLPPDRLKEIFLRWGEQRNARDGAVYHVPEAFARDECCKLAGKLLAMGCDPAVGGRIVADHLRRFDADHARVRAIFCAGVEGLLRGLDNRLLTLLLEPI